MVSGGRISADVRVVIVVLLVLISAEMAYLILTEDDESEAGVDSVSYFYDSIEEIEDVSELRIFVDGFPTEFITAVATETGTTSYTNDGGSESGLARIYSVEEKTVCSGYLEFYDSQENPITLAADAVYNPLYYDYGWCVSSSEDEYTHVWIYNMSADGVTIFSNLYTVAGPDDGLAGTVPSRLLLGVSTETKSGEDTVRYDIRLEAGTVCSVEYSRVFLNNIKTAELPYLYAGDGKPDEKTICRGLDYPVNEDIYETSVAYPDGSGTSNISVNPETGIVLKYVTKRSDGTSTCGRLVHSTVKIPLSVVPGDRIDYKVTVERGGATETEYVRYVVTDLVSGGYTVDAYTKTDSEGRWTAADSSYTFNSYFELLASPGNENVTRSAAFVGDKTVITPYGDVDVAVYMLDGTVTGVVDGSVCVSSSVVVLYEVNAVVAGGDTIHTTYELIDTTYFR